MTKNILVTDANGDIIGTTFPKRAKGLIKSGRASFVDEGTIRMSAGKAPPEHKSIISEETKSMIYITFKGDEWVRRNTDISFMTGLDGKLSETLMLGSWDSAESVAVSRPYILTPNTSYSYVFWLNGGENESANEVCNFKITFFNDWENCNVYRLNRGYIKPLLHQQGWELYEIPFTTPDVAGDVSVTFSFTAAKAPMAVMPAKEPAAYSDLKDEPDEYAAYRPQRHNIVFQDGWPSINQYGGEKYSTEAIREKLESKKSVKFGGKRFNFTFNNSKDDDEEDVWDELEELHDEIDDMIDDIEDALDDATDDLEDARDDLEDIQSNEDFDASKFQAEIDIFANELKAIDIDIDGYTEAIDGFKKDLKALDKQMFNGKPETVREALNELHSKVSSIGDTVDELDGRVSDLADDISDLDD
ncbi:MAG: hypothetical protein K5679_07745 [Lachnospiraceae bacterium]|nr:hypothetical protein [Lachnospiraceae bacterium]